MKLLCTIALLITTVSTLLAQTVPPALMVQQDGKSVPLGLANLRTEVRIFGSVAQTAITMTFANPTPRPMEGDFYFPLPEGATISGYALDINGTMVDGVAVEKHEARRVFEEVQRRGIDPGLVEWTKGNNFHTRVFPIPANGSRTVRVEYVSELIGGRDAPAYHLPLKFKAKVPEFSLRVEVVKPAAAPQVAKGELANFAFAKWRDSYVAETQQRDWLPGEDLVIALPKTDGPQVLVEKADDGQYYFAWEDYPAVPAGNVPALLGEPRRVVIFWDASGSRGASDHQREISLLRAYFQRFMELRDSTLPDISVDVVLLRNVASPPQRIEFKKAGPAAITAALEKIAYDGGTQLGAIGPVPGGPKPDLYLIFSDGLSTFGRDEPQPLDAPAYVFSADASANHPFLQRLAAANGGRYFNLANWKDAEVLSGIGRPAWSFLSALVHPGEWKDAYPQLPQPLAGRFTLVGKLAEASTTVVVNYGIPGGKPDQQTFQVSRADAVEGTLLRRLWAQKKLAHLIIDEKRNEKEITALGKQYGLVTPFTSLLVLDTLEQYVQYEIAPPKSLAAMREEYNRRIDTLEHQKQKEKADKLAEVVRMWEERVKWWNQEFKYAKDFKYKGDPDMNGVTMTGAMGGMAGEARPASPAAPALVPPAAASPAPRTSPPAAEPAAADELFPAAGGRQLYDLAKAGEKAAKPSQQAAPSGARQPGIVIKPWQPDTPYLKELQAAKGKKDLWAIYMKHRAQFGTSPAFFLDSADFFREAGDTTLALQVLSNIAELDLEEPTLLRVLGHRLEQIGKLDLAAQTFEHVLELRPEEPQSYRDLALVLAQRAKEYERTPDRTRSDQGGLIQQHREGLRNLSILVDYSRAVDLLTQVVMRRWDGRFPEVEVIALEEVNRIIPRAKAAGVSTIPLDPRLIKLLDCDVRIVMTWQADNTDIDLWVTEPSGEKAYYGHNRTTIGGLVSCDFTQGYGPEEYLVRRAAHGMYKIDANYFGTRATRLLGPVTVQADVFTNYGRPNEQRKSLTLRLKDTQETVRIGEIEF